MKSLISTIGATVTCMAAALSTSAFAQQGAISLRDSFPVGSNGLCEAQIVAPEPGAGLFDRRYSIVCRDASAPIGTLWVVRGRHADDAASRFVGGNANCATREGATAPQGLPGARAFACISQGSIIRTNLLVGEVGNRTFAASGFAAYDDALRLGVASLAMDRLAEGTVEIPLTQATDALAFARLQAENISADQALAEAYRRSNSGKFAEAAQFFATSAATLGGNSGLEARLNEGLLQSNLGNFAEALRIFNASRSQVGTSPALARLLRNYEAIDALNRKRPGEALAVLDRPLQADFGDPSAVSQLVIGEAMATRLSAETGQTLGASNNTLSPLERAQLLDGQASYLRATALRLQGRQAEAIAPLEAARTALAEVRGGRVVSIIWLRAQVLGELAELAERGGRPQEADALHQEAIALLDASYPDSPAYQSARAQLAGFYTRGGREQDALTLYREIVSEAEGRPAAALRGLMSPYFGLLLGDGPNAAAANDIFAASQLLQRPGLAQTQAVLARELSGGSDEASQLFRKATNIGRAVERLRAAILQSDTGVEPTPEAAGLLAERRQRLDQLLLQQAELQQRLAEYPRYRAVSDTSIDLDGLRAILRDGEAYVKLLTLDRETFVVYATKGEALAYRAEATPEQLEELVDMIRASIAVSEGGQVLTFPFDIARSRELYVRLFEPIAERLPANEHIVFEPDGALLRLPINLLVTDDASVERYQERLEGADGDEYDFRDTAWLGRGSQISTSVSPTAFRDVRASRPSNGAKAYLGLGQNTPVIEDPAAEAVTTRGVAVGGEECAWSPAIWANPIAADELFTAATNLGGDQVASATTILTEDAFTDSAIKERSDLAEYRILHFATHGLVTAPQPECPPRPALLTSFGEGESDGLLTFAEIFSLRLDADLVILSACDTAGSATVGATREAGVTSGGDFALDGLVRAFVGAGGRTVLASHWPVPDDFDATQRLITGLFRTAGTGTASALRQSQLDLMDDADTSHPFYWSAFAIVGDGTVQVMR